MRILIATGVYPPDHGGPAYYAKSLKDEFERLGHHVTIRTYTIEHSLPIGIRHLVYFFKTLPSYLSSDWTLVLDTFSVGFPIACMRMLFGGKAILRTGGDFLWEHHVERTREKILLSRFYDEPRHFTFKEKIIFQLTRLTLSIVSRIVFSTAYQRDIWIKAYRMDPRKVSIIENRFEPAQEAYGSTGKTFVYAAARPSFWKNADVAREAFEIARRSVPDARLEFVFDVPRDEAIEKIKNAYAVILVSLGDISPNYILRALSFGTPIILTSENGLKDRLGDAAMYVDPLDVGAIADAITDMCDPEIYASYQKRSAGFSFTHTYADIAGELLTLLS